MSVKAMPTSTTTGARKNSASSSGRRPQEQGQVDAAGGSAVRAMARGMRGLAERSGAGASPARRQLRLSTTLSSSPSSLVISSSRKSTASVGRQPAGLDALQRLEEDAVVAAEIGMVRA